MQKLLPKKELNNFLKSLIGRYELIAPVKADEKLTEFNIIEEPKEIYLKEITKIPAKKLFIPEDEQILEFKNQKIIENKENIRKNSQKFFGMLGNDRILKDAVFNVPDIKKRIIFGLRKCDLNAIKILDKLMFDEFYLNKRKNTILVGIFCEAPDEYCFCNSMELEDYYDLFFYPKDENYYISIASNKGLALVKNLKDAKNEIILKQENIKELKSKDIERHYRNKIWETDAEKCLSCSACTIYCPTCNCFDIKDKLNINLKDGIRTRTEMSCQLKSFSRVAGGKTFRDSRLSRFKHFIYHKIVYYKKRKGRYMCVGCGRCLRVCPTKIDWVNTINLLEDEEKIKKENKKGGKK